MKSLFVVLLSFFPSSTPSPFVSHPLTWSLSSSSSLLEKSQSGKLYQKPTLRCWPMEKLEAKCSGCKCSRAFFSRTTSAKKITSRRREKSGSKGKLKWKASSIKKTFHHCESFGGQGGGWIFIFCWVRGKVPVVPAQGKKDFHQPEYDDDAAQGTTKAAWVGEIYRLRFRFQDSFTFLHCLIFLQDFSSSLQQRLFMLLSRWWCHHLCH